jgi:membrane protein
MREWRSTLLGAGKKLVADNGTMLASALAYNTFFAIPSVLLVVVGVFTLVVGPGTIDSLMHEFGHVMPSQATSLLGSSLRRLEAHPAESISATVIGSVLAIWSTTTAMTTYMTAINLAYERKDRRTFVQKRVTALEMVAALGVAFLLDAALLMFGPPLERLVAAHAGGASGAIPWLWWIAQWPILVLGLLAAFAIVLHLGPDADLREWKFLTPGAVVAVFVWIAASAGFAVYSGRFGSYNKTWGSLGGVIVLLTWLWLGALALLYGAEINAEYERRLAVREPTQPEQQTAQRPPRSDEPRRRDRRPAPR